MTDHVSFKIMYCIFSLESDDDDDIDDDDLDLIQENTGIKIKKVFNIFLLKMDNILSQ